eukprot:g31848.t1
MDIYFVSADSPSGTYTTARTELICFAHEVTDVNKLELLCITITIPRYVLSHQQDRPSRGGGTVVYSWEGVALGVLNIDSGP